MSDRIGFALTLAAIVPLIGSGCGSQRQAHGARVALPMGSARLSEGRVSVLNKPGSSEYVPSGRTLELHGGRSVFSDARSVRFAKAVGSIRLFVAPGSRSDELCLIVENAAEASTAVDCAPRSVLTTGAIYLTKPDEAARTVDLFALVGDDVTSVGPATVENNVAVIFNLSGQLIALKNRAGQISMVDLGPQFLP
jgi:hypothetical protein